MAGQHAVHQADPCFTHTLPLPWLISTPPLAAPCFTHTLPLLPLLPCTGPGQPIGQG